MAEGGIMTGNHTFVTSVTLPPLRLVHWERAIVAASPAERMAEVDFAALEWMTDGACASVGGDFWYPEKGESPDIAKAICRRCDIRARCLEYALGHSADTYGDGRYGIWGGTTDDERQAILARREQEAA